MKQKFQAITKLDVSTKNLVEDAVEEIIYKQHQDFKTRSGDIEPWQSMRLDYLINELSKLISEQVKQNI